MDNKSFEQKPEGNLKSFAELEKQESVTPVELIATMADYAKGAAISAEVVIEAIDKAGLSEEQVSKIIVLSQQGRSKQEELGFSKDAAEYQKVVDYLENRDR